MNEEQKKAAELARAEEEKAKADAEAKAKAEREANETAEQKAEREAQEAEALRQKEAEDRLLKEKTAREAAEKAAAAMRFNESERKRKEREAAGGDPENEDDKPITKKDLNEILSRNNASIHVARIAEVAGQLATNETEKSLIIEIHKNRTFPSYMTLEEQIEESFVIANKKKLIGERNEAMRALKGRDGVDNNPAGVHRDAQKGKEPQLSDADKQAIVDAGLTFNHITRRYEKKLSNGDMIYRDPVTKKTVHVKR